MDTVIPAGPHTRFLRGLERSGGGVAVHVGDQALTYERLHELALLWGGALAETGARTVGVLAGKGVTAYAGILAGLYAGATIVPLRPDFPAARTARMVEAAGIDVIVADERGRAVAPAGVPVLGEPRASQALSAPLAPASETA
jgi:non-ribosomal peptide synthetase component F